MVYIYLMAIIIITILIKLPYVKVPLDADFGIYGYHAFFWLRKQKMPYRDTGENHPPGRWLLYAFLLKYFKLTRQLFRYSGIFFIVMTQIAVFVIASTLVSYSFAYIASLLYGILVSFPTFVWVQSSDEIEQTAFTSLAVALICLSPGVGSWIFFLAGLMCFFALYFKQSAYINTFPAVVLSIAIVNNSPENYVFLFLGVLPGLIFTAIYFYRQKILGQFLEIFSFSFKAFKMHLDNIFYGDRKIIRKPDTYNNIDPKERAYVDGENAGFKSRQKEFARDIYGKFFKQTLLIWLLISLSFLDIANSNITLILIVGIWLIFGLITVYLNKHVMPYHFLPLTAPMAIFATAGIFAIWNKFYFFSILVFVVLIIVTAILIWPELKELIKRESVQRGLMYINHPNEWMFFTLGEEIGKSLKEATTTEDYIYVWGAQYEIFLWAQRPSPTKSLFCPHPSVSGYVRTPFIQEDAILEAISQNPPKYLVVAASVKGFRRFQEFLHKNYYAVQGKEENVQIFRWIFADILPVDVAEAKARKKDFEKLCEYKQAEAENLEKINKFLKKAKDGDAFKYYNKILKITPFHLEANRQLSEYYFDIGNVDGIMKSLHYLLQSNSDNEFAAAFLGKICLLNEKYEQAEKLYQKAVNINPENPDSQKELAHTLLKRQKFAEAKVFYENYAIKHGLNAEITEKLMELYLAIQRKSEALYFGNLLLQDNHGPTEIFKKVTAISQNQIDRVDKSNSQTHIIWEGSQFVHHSLALVNREHTLRLINAGFNVSIIPYEKDQFEPNSRFQAIKNAENKGLPAVDIHVRHQWPPNLQAPHLGRWVVIQPWEFGFLPKEWVKVFNEQVDEMWVPSTYVRQVYIDSGVDSERVVVVPNGVDTTQFNPAAPPYKLKTKKKFKLLFVGGTIYRKGIDLLLKSYISAFTPEDDICLIIKDFGGKSFYKDQVFKDKINTLISGNNNPEIEYIDETLSEKDLVGLYTACDVLVHPYRGEGFGLPVLEAMACGIPTIVTDGGAAKDFCNNRTSLFVKAEKRVSDTKIIGDKELVSNAWFWECDLRDLSTKMSYAYRNPEIMKKMGDFAAPYVKSNWDWNITSLVLQNAVRKLSRKPIHRFQKDIQEVMNSVVDIPDSEEMGKVQKQYENHYKKSKLPSQLLGILLCARSLQDKATLRKYLPEADQCFADNPNVLNLMGIIHFELEEIDRAIDFFGKSLAFNEKSIDTRRNLAESLIMKEDYEKGILEFMEVIKQNPKDIPALLRMAQFHLETERITEAEEFITKILSLDPNNKMALELKTMLHGKN